MLATNFVINFATRCWMKKKFKSLMDKMSPESRERSCILFAELKVEHYAAIDFFERTGKDYYKLSPTKQRKVIENWKEDHQ